jgi:hypothetical protein
MMKQVGSWEKGIGGSGSRTAHNRFYVFICVGFPPFLQFYRCCNMSERDQRIEEERGRLR